MFKRLNLNNPAAAQFAEAVLSTILQSWIFHAFFKTQQACQEEADQPSSVDTIANGTKTGIFEEVSGEEAVHITTLSGQKTVVGAPPWVDLKTSSRERGPTCSSPSAPTKRTTWQIDQLELSGAIGSTLMTATTATSPMLGGRIRIASARSTTVESGSIVIIGRTCGRTRCGILGQTDATMRIRER